MPLVYIFVRSAEGGLDRYLETVLSESSLALLGRSLALVVAVLVGAIATALPAAWVVVRTDLPWRRFWATMAALPLVFPSYIAAFSLVAVLGPKGYVQGWLEPLGVTALPDWIYGFGGAAVALILFTYPYLFLLLVAAIRRLDPALEESSRSLGTRPWATFFRVVLPQLRPALVGGALLVALYTLSDFGAVSIVRFDTFTVSIYSAYRSLFDRSVAAALATLLVALTAAFILCEGWWLGRERRASPSSGRQASLLPLGRWKVPTLLGMAALVTFAVGLPVGVVCFWGLRALALGKSLGPVWSATTGSLFVSGMAALVAVALSLPVAAWSVRFDSRGSRWVERAAKAGYALPGLVIALSLVVFATRWARPIYQTLGLVIAAYVLRFLPQALASTRSALLQVSPTLEEAARSLGRSAFAVFRTVTLPLIRPGLLAGATLVFLTSMKELPATLILRPTGFETLATRIWATAGEGIYSEAALPSLVLVAVSALPVYWLMIRPVLMEAPGPKPKK